MQDFQIHYRFAEEISDYFDALLEICVNPIDQGHVVVLEHFEADGWSSETLEAAGWPSQVEIVEDDANRKNLEGLHKGGFSRRHKDFPRHKAMCDAITELQEKATKRRRQASISGGIYTRIQLAFNLIKRRSSIVKMNEVEGAQITSDGVADRLWGVMSPGLKKQDQKKWLEELDKIQHIDTIGTQ